ncbi:hypothetical protein KDW54_07095 [Burkholderia ambifaria]|uniref:hypothetical protein n=1 Tax=Burkholderia ambifaria TaxID=152480 RepID=UPI001BA046B7|nr:hypothetical protein [Burkholderia ambifaria]MBR8182160.1 hypothetical protein [Burkholderia ambifaria]
MIDIEKMKALVVNLRYWQAEPCLPGPAKDCGDAATAIDSLLSELEATKRERDEMMKALAECRDAMPMEYDSTHLGAAVGDPLEVPLFVKDIVSRLRAELEAREADRRDAERYRTLRDFGKDGVNMKPPVEHVHAMIYSHQVGAIPASRVVTGDELDRAIDAALAQRQGEDDERA